LYPNNVAIFHDVSDTAVSVSRHLVPAWCRRYAFMAYSLSLSLRSARWVEPVPGSGRHVDGPAGSTERGSQHAQTHATASGRSNAAYSSQSGAAATCAAGQ